MEDLEDGIKVGGEIVKTIRFCDNKAVVCPAKGGLQRMLNKINKTSKNYGMKINSLKAKTIKRVARTRISNKYVE